MCIRDRSNATVIFPSFATSHPSISFDEISKSSILKVIVFLSINKSIFPVFYKLKILELSKEFVRLVISFINLP